MKKRFFFSLAFIIPAVFSISCKSSGQIPKSVPDKENQEQAADEKKFEVSGLLVEKEFIKKNNQPAGFKELYLRLSINDYFIKFCESSVTTDDVKAYYNPAEEFNSITVEIEIRNGEWDICPGDPEEMQSRIGEYVIIKRIIK